MKGKNFLGVIFLLTLISSAVFGYVAENSRQGFAEFSTISQPASDCENADLHRGSSLQSYNGMSGALYCPKHGKKKCGQCPSAVTAEEYSYLPQDWRRVTRATYTHDGQRCKHGYGYGHGRGHVCDEIPGHGKGHDRDGQNDEAVYVSVYENQDESHEYLLRAGDRDAHNRRHEQYKCMADQQKPNLELVRAFIGGPSTDDLEYTRQDHRSLSHLKDGLGSTIALTVKDGRPVARIGYDVWGNLKWPDKPGHGLKPCDDKDVPDWLDRFENGRSFGSGIDPWHFGRHHGKAITPYLYAGRRFDQFAGQYFNRNRYYSPKVGRFITKDPISFEGWNNLFCYADNNPLRFKDPYGLDVQDAIDLLNNIDKKLAVELGDYYLLQQPVDFPAIIQFAQRLGNNGCLEQVVYEIERDPGVLSAMGKNRLPDDAKVVRGGLNTADRIRTAIVVHVGIKGVSVQSANGKSIVELSGFINHNQIGVTTVGEIRKFNSDVIPTPGKGYHCTVYMGVGGITPEQLSALLQPIRPNPAKFP